MLTVSKNQLKKIMDASAIAGRLNELNAIEGYVPSAIISRRKKILKGQFAELVGKEKKEDDVINIHIEIPEERPAKKEKESFSIRNIFSKLEVEDDDDQIVSVFKTILPAESRGVLGKLITEL